MQKQYKEEWFEKANQDYKVIKKLFKDDDRDFYEIILFHCQQCAEKYLKGFLAYHNQEPEKTHSIEKILKNCQNYDDFSSFNDLTDLTFFAVTFRYPNEPIEIDKNDILESIKTIDKLIKFIKLLLAKDRLL